METNEKAQPEHAVRFKTFEEGSVRFENGWLALESALEVVVNGRAHSLLMQTPGAEKNLVVGYLYTEGLIDSPGEIGRLDFVTEEGILGLEGCRVEVDLPGLSVESGLPERPALSFASCGLCGKEALDRLGRGLTWVRSKHEFSWPVLYGLLPDLRRHQPLYERTRGVHAAALYEADGSFLCCYEDVGRHNALDKVIGQALLEGWSFQDKIVLLSGRASLEMILKMARAGLPLLLCFSRPTALAVEASKALNLTLVGRLEERRLACYTHYRRLKE
ncbi:MAG: formate dehydrogenase accessory sulfurtransferase FdhD [Pseudomonadota bacterium]